MFKIAVMGDRDSIYGFASVGLDIFPIEDASVALRTINSLIENEYAVIYMTESLYVALANELQSFKELKIPAIIPIPGVFGNSGVGIEQIKKSVEKAVGSDILFSGK